MEWDAELTEDVPGERLAWRTVGRSEPEHSVSLRFEPSRQGRATELYVTMTWKPPAGALHAAVAALSGNHADKQLDEDLWRFKQLLETGAVATTRGQPRGASLGDTPAFAVSRPYVNDVALSELPPAHGAMR